jgi:hypothetical protein
VGPTTNEAFRVVTRAISGVGSLHLRLRNGGSIAATRTWAAGEGPAAVSVTATAKVRVDTADAPTDRLVVCVVATPQDTAVAPVRTCDQHALGDGNTVVDVALAAQTGGARLSSAAIELTRIGTTKVLSADVDDASLTVGADPVAVAAGDELVDLLTDNGFETSVAGFAAISPADGSVALSQT